MPSRIIDTAVRWMSLTTGAMLIFAPGSFADAFETQRTQVLALGELTDAPEQMDAAGYDAGNQYGRSLGDNELYQTVWDPVLRLDSAKMPMLWFSWPQDKHFPLDCQAASYHAAAGPQTVTLIPNLRHGHAPPWNRPESYAFAESIVRDGNPWCRQTKSAVSDGRYRAEFVSKNVFDKAVLVSTVDTGITGERNWVESPAELNRQGNRWQVSATLPADTTAWYANVHSGDLCVSSSYEEMEE